MEPRIGVDIGRVLIAGDGPDTSFFKSDEESLRVPAVEGAFDGVASLVGKFAGRVWLVSKCGTKIQKRTLAWLNAHDFWKQTRLPEDHVRFCKERPQKALHARELGLTHFIDDRVDVLEALDLPHRYLFGALTAPAGMIPVAGWPQLLEKLLQKIH